MCSLTGRNKHKAYITRAIYCLLLAVQHFQACLEGIFEQCIQQFEELTWYYLQGPAGSIISNNLGHCSQNCLF